MKSYKTISEEYGTKNVLEWLCNETIKEGRKANLHGANLYYANLRGADLRGANLQGVDLRGADLRGANLQGADLYYVDLRGANLRGADLRGANLQGADLYYVDLRGADLRGANLQGADLYYVDLQGANLRGAGLDYSCWPLRCGGLSVHIDDRIGIQLLFHVVQNILYSKNTSQRVKEIVNKKEIIDLCNEFHRSDVKKLEAI
jgi:hypothetical protein